MNPSIYIPIIILWIVIFYVLLRNRRAVAARQMIKKRKTEDNTEMRELAKRFMDKELSLIHILFATKSMGRE